MITKRQQRTLVIGVALACSFCVFSCAVTQNGQALDWALLTLGGAGMLMFVGEVINEMSHQNDQEKIKALAMSNKENYVLKLYEVFKDTYSAADSNTQLSISNNVSVLNLVTERAEWQARNLYLSQKANNSAYTYNSAYVMNSYAVCQYLSGTIEESSLFYSAAFDTLSDEPQYFEGSIFGDLKVYWGGFAYAKILYDKDNHANTHYVYCPSLTNGGSSTNAFYLYEGQKVLATLTDVAGNYTINLKDTSNNIVKTWNINADKSGLVTELNCSGLPQNTGYYFDNNDFKYFGNIIVDINSNNLINPISILCYETENNMKYCNYYNTYHSYNEAGDWWMPGGQESQYGYGYGSTLTEAARLIVGDHNSGGINYELYDGRYVENHKMVELYNTIVSIRNQANTYATVYYNQLKASGDDGHYEPMPDSLFPELTTENTNLTAEQLWALLAVYRQQQADYFANHTGTMNLSDANYSPDSLNLLVRGALYDASGNVLMDNVSVWSPFVTAKDQNIHLGVNYFNDSITAVKWGSGATISAYLAVNHTAAEMRILYPPVGSYANILEIYYNGQSVNNRTLTIEPFHTIVPNYVQTTPSGGDIPIDWGSSDMLLLYAGVICFLAGVFMSAALPSGMMKLIGVILIFAGIGLMAYWLYTTYGGELSDPFGAIKKLFGMVIQ